MIASITLAAALVSQVSAYCTCNPNNWRLQGQTVQNVPIVSSGTFQNAQGQPITVAGSVSIINGCSFSVTGLTFTGVASAGIYGGVGDVGPASPSVRLINQYLNSTTTPVNQNYTFISSAGAAVCYNDFNQFRLFDPVSGLMVGVANIPSDGLTVPGPPSTLTARPPSSSAAAASSASSSAPASTQTSNNAEGVVSTGFLSLVSFFFMF